jgi:hypothetical protein
MIGRPWPRQHGSMVYFVFEEIAQIAQFLLVAEF